MAKRQNPANASKTNAQEVRRQNQAAAQGQSKFGTEFASETDVQEVRAQNQQSENKKK
ncbi:gamma-type small acid-soluble spore protein [Gracilibacillus oryzae]|uniref:Small, acid-soluble spore protein gamma-type n=1 Tax=Gracilibacillus oryzae TaxID=1672701 RepID=A0A7C8L3U6_9BACI|nr:gamma-type small acid-soluble spore protein [Gracilibacillus oryzae]KAB8125623.1 gamma-type small acid-soluble spore protein [Gracilibacillus oryzae]